jgi:hypothetical protein
MLCIIVPTIGNRPVEINRLFKSLNDQTNKNFYVLCMVQGNHELLLQSINTYNLDIQLIELSKKGLSYSRNIAFNYIKENTTYITFSDDDCWYPNDMVERIAKVPHKLNQCVCFKIFDPYLNKFYKNYQKNTTTKLSKLQTLKVSSIEIFVPNSVIDKNIKFDEKFGLGTNFPSGEENIFLFDLLENKFEIIYYPDVIVYHSVPVWTNKEYIFKGKGALFTRLYNKPLAIIFVLIYSIKKLSYFTKFKSQFIQMIKEVIVYN